MKLTPQIPSAFRCLFDPEKRRQFHWGGRQSAKTTSIATRLVVAALTEYERILCVRFNKATSSDTQREAINGAVRDMGIEHLFTYSRTGAFVCKSTGAEFLFHGLFQQHGLRGQEGITTVWMEEAQYLEKGPDGNDFLDFTATVVRHPEVRIYVSGNPRYHNDPAYQWCMEQKRIAEAEGETDLAYTHTTYRDNPWFSEAADRERRLQQRMDPGYYDHEWEGKFLSSLYDETFLTYALVQSCIHGFEKHKGELRTFRDQLHFGLDPSDGSDKTILAARSGPFLEDVLNLTQAPGNVTNAVMQADKLAVKSHAKSLTYDEGGMLGPQITGWFTKRTTRPYAVQRVSFGMAPGGPDEMYGLTRNKDKFRFRNSQMAENLRDRAQATWLLEQGEQVPLANTLLIDPRGIDGRDGHVDEDTFIAEMCQALRLRMGGDKIDIDKAPRGLDSPDTFDGVCCAYHDDVAAGLVMRNAV